MSNLSRRSLVASAAALPALAVPTLASSEPDPIFAAIEKHRKAYDDDWAPICHAFSAVEEKVGVGNHQNIEWQEADRKNSELGAIADDAMHELLETVPTSLAGALALLTWLTVNLERGDL